MIFELLIVLLLAALGMPLFAVIAAIALVGFHAAGYDLIAVAVEYYRLGDKPGLIAIPMFTFAGYLLGESGTPKRLVRLSMALLGWLPGGLAIVSICACTLFTAFTGATGVTLVALGAVLYPALRHGQRPDHAVRHRQRIAAAPGNPRRLSRRRPPGVDLPRRRAKPGAEAGCGERMVD